MKHKTTVTACLVACLVVMGFSQLQGMAAQSPISPLCPPTPTQPNPVVIADFKASDGSGAAVLIITIGLILMLLTFFRVIGRLRRVQRQEIRLRRGLEMIGRSTHDEHARNITVVTLEASDGDNDEKQ